MRFSEVWEREMQIREGLTTLWMKKRFWKICRNLKDPFVIYTKREIQSRIVLLATEYPFKKIEQLVRYKMKREFPSILIIEYLELKKRLMMKKIIAPPKETSAPKFIRAKLKVPPLETETIPAARVPKLTLADFEDFEFDSGRFKVPLLETETVPTSLESTAYFSETEDQLRTSFGTGPYFRFEVYKVVPRRRPNIDPYVYNISGYDERELPLFGMIKAQNSLSDPSHDGSFYMFNADGNGDADPDPSVYTSMGCFYMFNRDCVDPLVLTSDAISPPEICYHSIQVSTSLKLTCKLYGIAFKELISFKNVSHLFKYYEAQPEPEFRLPKKGQKTIVNDVLQFCDDCHDINFSEYFAKKPRGGFASCKLKGKDGYLEFYYAALKYAVDATLEVDFNAPSKETVVVGRVVAYYGKDFDYDCDAAREDHHYAKMFETTPDGFLLPGKINLMRSVLAVPAQFSLIIVAELRDFSSKKVILSGSYEFRVPLYDPSSFGSIKSNDGFSLGVKVGWKLPL